ncbi:diacylglycerol kinase [Camelimonas abortus]|uniref:diacylglycerol kinase n=1 Tax=Camelimonas abortus TaxID=1017184 RepID=UPI00366E21F8
MPSRLVASLGRQAAALFAAGRNSLDGLRFLLQERAFRLEALALAAGVLAAPFIARDVKECVVLVGAIVAVLAVEALNTAIEQVCNLVTREFRPEIKAAKDCASCAVTLSLVVCGALWLAAAGDRLGMW